MKRIHAFEFEDFKWFPDALRNDMTNYIVAMHRLLNSTPQIASLIKRGMDAGETNKVTDLCSGGAGPMIWVAEELETNHGVKGLEIKLTDLYPNTTAAERINSKNNNIQYILDPVDATNPGSELSGVRTMICSMHHMRPSVARKILSSALEQKQPMVVYEISNNTIPWWIMWLSWPINFLTVLFITPFIRPLSFRQVVLTYLIPVLPFFIAWDGMISYMRTYSMSDWDEVLTDLNSPDYVWEKGVLKGKGSDKSYVLGLPKNN